MLVSINTNFSMELNDYIVYVDMFSDEVHEYFQNKHYGDDLKELVFGIISFNPEYNIKIKPKKKYYKGKNTLSYDGVIIEIEDALEYEIIVDFNKFLQIEEHKIYIFIARSIFNSFHEISKIKKLENFNLKAFSEDFYNQFCKTDCK